MDAGKEVNLLTRKGVKPTANRILVLRAVWTSAQPLSMSDLESVLAPMDKSSIFRTLNLFVSHQLLHAIEDGSGILRYEVCDAKDQCTLADMHTHFYCESCHQTFCFKTIHIPEIDLPEGFTMHSVNYMVKGICPRCAAKPVSLPDF